MNSAKAPYRIIVSGGGTGGHVYPAIAIANRIRTLHPDAEILFVGAKGKMEMELVPEAGYQIRGLWISGIQRRLTADNISFPLKLFSSLRTSGRILKQFKPQVVVGVGGYASGPLLWKAASAGVPTLIQEQNSYAGLTNRLLGKKVNRICVAYDHMDRYFPREKLVLTGNPVRSDIAREDLPRDRAVQQFGLDPARKTMLVIGGSLGARTVNESLLVGLTALEEKNIQLIWQVGKLYVKEMRLRMAGRETSGVKIFDFIRKMDEAYAAADLVVSRAGALAISELCLVGKPVVLVPSPNVAEDHQTMNARALADRQAAILVPDKEARERLVAEALHLIRDADRMDTMSRNIRLMARPNAAADIANEVMDLIS